MTTSAAQVQIYGAFVRNAFLEMLAYRLRYYTGVLTYLLLVSAHYFIWQAVYASREPGATIKGFTLSEMVTYITVGWISRSLYFSNIDEEVNELVRTGQISVYLLRPVNFQLMMIVRAFGSSLFRLLFFTLPIGAVLLLIFPIEAPKTAVDFGLYIGATGLGFLIFALLNFLIGLLAFYCKSIKGLIRAKYQIVQLFSGLLLPLSFFPDWAELILKCLPFQAVVYIPLQLYLGKVPSSELISVLLVQVFWVVFLIVLGRMLWVRARNKLTLQGG